MSRRSTGSGLGRDGDVLTYRCDGCGIDVYAMDEAELQAEIDEELDILWHTFAMADDAKFTEGAKHLKQSVLFVGHAWKRFWENQK